MNSKRLIDNPTTSSIVFYPRKTPIPSKLNLNFKVLKFEITKDITIGGLLYLNNPNTPTILLFHGNGEVALDYQYFAPLFFESDINLAVVDFRGYGFSSGEPYYTSLISDAMPIYHGFENWINDNGLKKSLFIQGRSLGSICAAEIGSHNPKNLRGIIFESGFASTYNMMTRLFRISSPDLTPSSLTEYSNDTRVRKFSKPTLIIHGTQDWIIPMSESELLYENLPKNIEKELVIIKGAGHNDIFSYTHEYFSPLRKFIQKFK